MIQPEDPASNMVPTRFPAKIQHLFLERRSQQKSHIFMSLGFKCAANRLGCGHGKHEQEVHGVDGGLKQQQNVDEPTTPLLLGPKQQD